MNPRHKGSPTQKKTGCGGKAERQQTHKVRAGAHHCRPKKPTPQEHRPHVEPWLAALFQAEHLSLLVGSGFTTAVARAAGCEPVTLDAVEFKAPHADGVAGAAEASAENVGRRRPNLEDQLRAAMDLVAGLRVLASKSLSSTPKTKQQVRQHAGSLMSTWTDELNKCLSSLAREILRTEHGIAQALADPKQSGDIRRLLAGFILPFASRTATRERTHIFTTNYDRLIERSCDLLGLRVMDRFVGVLAPVFHSSRLGVDLHYHPPGIRGEPRYLEGVVRLTKLHGSVDWRTGDGPSGRLEVQRAALPFGAAEDRASLPDSPADRLLIYPNAAKDMETLQFPYADLFRDFASAVCRPNSVVVTYGFGFGDDHLNRVLRDALTIPSVHLVIISWDDAGGRLEAFLQSVGRESQITLLRGPHFGDLATLVKHYLPKPAMDRATWKMVDLVNRRTPLQTSQSGQGSVDKGRESPAGGSA